jgi:hypothetical protein
LKDLKRCPFCGEEATYHGPDDEHVSAGCGSCGVATQMFYGLRGRPDESAYDKAAFRWNQRADTMKDSIIKARSRLAELEAENEKLSLIEASHKTEIAELKEKNQSIAYEYSLLKEQLRMLEADNATKRRGLDDQILRLRRELELEQEECQRLKRIVPAEKKPVLFRYLPKTDDLDRVFETSADLINWVRVVINIPSLSLDKLHLERWHTNYGPDLKYRLFVEGYGVVGFTDGPLE